MAISCFSARARGADAPFWALKRFAGSLSYSPRALHKLSAALAPPKLHRAMALNLGVCPCCVPPVASTTCLMDLLHSTTHNAFPVVSHDDETPDFLGLVSRRELAALLRHSTGAQKGGSSVLHLER